MFGLLAGLGVASFQCFLGAQETDPQSIIKKVEAAYAALETYEAEGEIVSNIEMRTTKNSSVKSFTLRLKKPDLFRVTWDDQGADDVVLKNGGAAWVENGKALFFMTATSRISEMESGRMALAAATGVSSGAANTIPSLFFDEGFGGGTIFTSGEQLKLVREEPIGEAMCYVLSGPSVLTKELTVWIGKRDFLVRKMFRSLERAADQEPVALPKMTDKMIEDSLRATGQEVSKESLSRMREMIKNARKTLETAQLKGNTVESHMRITFPELEATDFIFSPPIGARLNKSLFGEPK